MIKIIDKKGYYAVQLIDLDSISSTYFDVLNDAISYCDRMSFLGQAMRASSNEIKQAIKAYKAGRSTK